MKVLVFVKATSKSEKGIMPNDQELARLLNDMGKFNERLIAAGIMAEADGLQPSSAGKRITFSDSGATSVIDGPFVETKELVAGYWVWNVKSMDEAVSWARQCPNPMPGEEGVLELRPTNSLADFEALLTDESRGRFERMDKALKQKKAKAKPAKKAAPARKKAKAKTKSKSKRAKSKK